MYFLVAMATLSACGIFVDDGPWDLTLGLGVAGETIDKDIVVLFPDQSSSDNTQYLKIWTMDPAGLRCDDLISGDIVPESDTLQIKLPLPEGSALRNMPDKQVMFFVEARDANVALLRGCTIARARKKLGITILLTCICQPDPGICAAQDEVPGNSKDDDCDGMTDECDPQKNDCDDDEPCTQDLCVNGKCQYSVFDDGVECDDLDRCTDNDSCLDGLCTGDAKDCSSLDVTCKLGVCNKLSGECEAIAVPNGTMCDDNQYCLDGECRNMTWVTIAGGTYTMGDNEHANESPEHTVTVPSFQITKTEITLELYKYCVTAGACSEPSNNDDKCTWKYESSDDNEDGDYPINCVDWNQAKDFCEWAGGRLPTEAEWEFAARSRGQDKFYPWGDEVPSCEFAIIRDSGTHYCKDAPQNVCSKEAGNTEQGLCDMAGNVQEWTADWWYAGYDNTPTDGSAMTGSQYDTSRSVRGGSFEDTANYSRCTWRYGADNDEQAHSLGFRCAR